MYVYYVESFAHIGCYSDCLRKGSHLVEPLCYIKTGFNQRKPPHRTVSPDITLEDTQLPLEHTPKILGVIMDPSLSFHKHCNYVSDRIDKRNNMQKALAGSSWGQEKETLLLTYNGMGKSIASYAAPTQVTRALRRYRQCRMRL